MLHPEPGSGFLTQNVCTYDVHMLGALEPWNFMTFHILGISSSQLTFTPSFFRGVGEKPPTSHHHSPSLITINHRGEIVEVRHIPPGGFTRGDWLEASEAVYYQQKISLVAKVEKEEIDSGERELRCELTGTQSEELLKFGTAQKPCQVRPHLCSSSCPQLRENPDLIHVKMVKKMKVEDPKGWQVNLVEENETRMLQAEGAEWQKREEIKSRTINSPYSPVVSFG